MQGNYRVATYLAASRIAVSSIESVNQLCILLDAHVRNACNTRLSVTVKSVLVLSVLWLHVYLNIHLVLNDSPYMLYSGIVHTNWPTPALFPSVRRYRVFSPR
jgi:hypothetical protein